MVDVRYRPGAPTDAWRAAVSGETVAVLPPSITAHTAEAVWRRLAAGGIAALIEALTGAFGTSLTAIPPFALATVEDGGVRVAVRGPIELIVEGESGTEAVSGAGVATWVERLIPGTYRVTLSIDGDMDEAASLPLVEGVAPIAALVLTAGAAPARPVTPAPTAVATPSGADAGVPAAAAAAVPTAVDAAVPPAGDVAPDAGLAGDMPVIPVAAPSAEFDPAVAAEADATGSEQGGADAEPDVADAAAPADAEPADVPAAAPAAAAPAAATPAEPATVAPADPVGVDTWLPTATAAPTDDEILFGATVARPPATKATAPLPEAVPPRPPLPKLPPVPSKPPASDFGDHDGETIAVSDMRRLRDADREKIESTDSVPPRRPTKGRIRLSTGRVVELERPVVIGRRPKSTRTTDADLPTLVAVESPEQDISRSHVEIRAEGEHVLVTDLDTTNGTVLLRGGNDPVRLHPGEPTMVVSDDTLDLGDGVTVVFEDLP